MGYAGWRRSIPCPGNRARYNSGKGETLEYIIRSREEGPKPDKEGTATGGPYLLVHRKFEGNGPFSDTWLERVVPLREPGRVSEETARARLVGIWGFTEVDSVRAMSRSDPLTGIRFEADGTAKLNNIPGSLRGELLEWSESEQDAVGLLEHGSGKWELVREADLAWGGSISSQKARTVLGLWKEGGELRLAFKPRGVDSDRGSMLFMRRSSD